MLADVEWRDTPVVIRKVQLTLNGVEADLTELTADDCVTLFIGNVDSATINEQQIQLHFSSDLSQFSLQLPRENMHGACRFSFADDQCTLLRFHQDHYRAKTASGGSTTVVPSSDFDEDDGVPPWRAQSVVANAGTDVIGLVAHELIADQRVTFGGSALPGGITAGLWYYVIPASVNTFQISLTAGGSVLEITSTGTAVTMTSEPPYGADLINALADGDITASSQASGFQGYRVKTSYTADLWKISGDADWGTLNQSIYNIPDAQAGLENHLLKPFITFDLGSAKNPNLWRVAGVADVSRDRMVRLIQFFSSTDDFASDAHFEGYFEMPARQGGEFIDWVRPGLATAQTARRYWRICVRSRWNETFYADMLRKVTAHRRGPGPSPSGSGQRHYWKGGRITFASNTTTVALRGVSRRVLGSYAGEIECEPLPSAPVNGDDFVIERGCGRQFNDCARRKNTRNYGGFDPLVIAQLAR